MKKILFTFLSFITINAAFNTQAEILSHNKTSVLLPLDIKRVTGDLSSYYSAADNRVRQRQMAMFGREEKFEVKMSPEEFLIAYSNGEIINFNGLRYLSLSRYDWQEKAGLLCKMLRETYDNDESSSIVKYATLYTVNAYGYYDDELIIISDLQHQLLRNIELRVGSKREYLGWMD